MVFSDSDSLPAIDTILAGRPTIVALNTTFATTARGAALVARIKGDADLTGIDVRVLIEDEHHVPLALSHPAPTSENMLIETSRPLGRAGTRAALRYLMDRRAILVNGERGHLIDLSVTGAQVLVPMRMRPNEPVRAPLTRRYRRGALSRNGRLVGGRADRRNDSVPGRRQVHEARPEGARRLLAPGSAAARI